MNCRTSFLRLGIASLSLAASFCSNTAAGELFGIFTQFGAPVPSVILAGENEYGIHRIVQDFQTLYQNNDSLTAGIDEPIQLSQPIDPTRPVEAFNVLNRPVGIHPTMLLAYYPIASTITLDDELVQPVFDPLNGIKSRTATVGQTLGIIDGIDPSYNSDVEFYHSLHQLTDGGQVLQAGADVDFVTGQTNITTSTTLFTFTEPGTYVLNSYVPYDGPVGSLEGTYSFSAIETIHVVPESSQFLHWLAAFLTWISHMRRCQ